jgi:hypothetical protein
MDVWLSDPKAMWTAVRMLGWNQEEVQEDGNA